MNYESLIKQNQDNDYKTYTLHFNSLFNNEGSVRFIDHSQEKDIIVDIKMNNMDKNEPDIFDYRFKEKFPTIVADIIDLAVAIYVSDRLAPQNFNKKQSHLNIVLQVRCPELLNAESFRTKLDELLNWTTGRKWFFEFQKRKDAGRPVEQQKLIFPTAPRAFEVALWSGGLDALAGLYTRLKMHPEKEKSIVLFGSGSNKITFGCQKQVAEQVKSIFPNCCNLLRLPIDIHSGNHRKNKSSRARGVVFTLLGSACAYLMDQQVLCVYENGIGAINLPYRASAIGLDHSRSVHPLTLLMISEIVSELLGEEFRVYNPFLFWTKAEMCKKLAEDRQYDLVSLTKSCDSLHRKPKQPIQCGYCSSCLLRRQALNAANIEDKTDYILLHGERPVNDPSLPFLNMRQQVRMLHQLLDSSDQPGLQWEALSREFLDLEDIVDRTAAAEKLLPNDMQGRLIHLYKTYVSEWDTVESRIAHGLLNNGL